MALELHYGAIGRLLTKRNPRGNIRFSTCNINISATLYCAGPGRRQRKRALQDRKPMWRFIPHHRGPCNIYCPAIQPKIMVYFQGARGRDLPSPAGGDCEIKSAQDQDCHDVPGVQFKRFDLQQTGFSQQLIGSGGQHKNGCHGFSFFSRWQSPKKLPESSLNTASALGFPGSGAFLKSTPLALSSS